MSERIVGLCGGEYEAAICDLLPANRGRASLVNALIKAYRFDHLCQPIILTPASREELLRGHDASYIDFMLKRCRYIDKELDEVQRELLKKFDPHVNFDDADESDGSDNSVKSDYKSEVEVSNETLSRYGLIYDSPVFPLMSKYITVVAGGTISAAKFLNQPATSGVQRISLNWNGGRHHAKRAQASGFCYVNDIVLGILELRKKFDNVLYIDLDLHHGDGVETAFKFSNKVVTFSIHRRELGFYPGTGDLCDKGKGKGVGFTFNLPLKHGLSDASFAKVIDEGLLPTISQMNPQCLVVQCGLDGLNFDQHQEWNITMNGYGEQIKKIINVNKPTLLLGGGGYNHTQAARCWTYLTSIALNLELKFDLLPEHELLDSYEEENYEFWSFPQRNMIDDNTDEYINELLETVRDRLRSW